MSSSKNYAKMDRVKAKIIDLLKTYNGGCNENEMKMFDQWICSREYIKDIEKYEEKKKVEDKLDSIVKELRSVLPLNAILPSENIFNPIVGSNSDCTPETTYHVDEFLYNHEDLEKFFPDQTRFCEDCGSGNIKETQLISHSLSRLKLQHIFNVMLPLDCSDKRILDVGSRIGAVLYGAYYYSNCKNIYGVEINKELYDIQKKIVSHYGMEDRITVINDDILNQTDLLSTFDIVILNNVFEFFMEIDKQIQIWRFLKNKLKKGCLLITIPSTEETFMTLEVYEEFSKWLHRIPVSQEDKNLLYEEEDELEFHDMYLYTVK